MLIQLLITSGICLYQFRMGKLLLLYFLAVLFGNFQWFLLELIWIIHRLLFPPRQLDRLLNNC